MKVVLLALGSRGDVQPMVALGRELACRDIPVTVVALRDLAGLAEAAGLDRVPIERAMSESVQAVAGAQRGMARNPVAYQRAVSRWLAGIAPEVIAAEQAAVAPGDLVVAGLLSIDDAAALRRITGCQVVNVLLAPLVPTAAGPSAMVSLRHRATSRVNRWAGSVGLAAAAGMCTTTGRALRAGHGLPRTSAARFVRLLRDTPTLLAVSPVLVPPAPDWPAHVWQTGAWLEPDSPWSPPERLRAFLAGGPPPVFVSFGSVPGTDPRADVELVATAAAQAGRRVVIGSGATELPELPPGAYVLADAPYRWLLPRMAAVVHHGGAGTTTEALLAGVPNVVVALGADQPFYGRRIHELGAGPAPIKRPELTTDRLTTLITNLTGNPADTYRTAAAAVRQRLQAEHGVQAAADRLATMLRR